MKKLKIYLETTIFNFVFADDSPDKKQDMLKLFEEIDQGEYILYTSDYALKELEEAGKVKKARIFDLIEQYQIIVLKPDKNAEILADKYINENIIPEKYRTDGLHIAIATINDLDIIFSHNSKHILKLKTIMGAESINLREGYNPIIIHSPTAVMTMTESELKIIDEIHAIREQLYEETKDMTPEERTKYHNDRAREIIKKYNLEAQFVKSPTQ